MKSDQSLLQAALIGYQTKIRDIEQAMAEIRQQLGQTQAAAPPPAGPKKAAKRKMSAAGRRRIAAAQRKRWAEYNAKKAATAK
jgi:hypothetical protein